MGVGAVHIGDSCKNDRELLFDSGHKGRLAFSVAALTSLVAYVALYTWRLDQVPPYLNQDEAGFGLASYLLATTGRDQFGNFLPPYIVYFDHRELGNAMICYLGIPFVVALGLSSTSLRLAMVVAGLISLILFGSLSWHITRNRWLSLAGLGMMALTPLFFVQSRIYLDPILIVPFITGWLLCLALFERSRDSRYILIASLVLGIGAYSYSTARMLMPMYLVLTLVAIRVSGSRSWKTVLGAAGIFVLCMVPMMIFVIQNGELYTARIRDISWLTRGGITPKAPVSTYVAHYLVHFDPLDLFVSGDRSPIHSTGRAGMFLRGTVPLAMLGLVTLAMSVIRQRSRFALLLLAALALFPVPNALLVEVHRPVRAAHLIPLYLTVCMVGLLAILHEFPVERMRGKLVLAGVAVLLAMEFTPFYQDYLAEYPIRAVSADYFNGNKPLAFRAVMGMDGNEFYLDREDTMDSTFAGFFQVAYAYQGTIRLVEPSNAGTVPSGALLLTRRQAKYGDLFEEVAAIPEIAAGIRGPYVVLRKR